MTGVGRNISAQSERMVRWVRKKRRLARVLRFDLHDNGKGGGDWHPDPPSLKPSLCFGRVGTDGKQRSTSGTSALGWRLASSVGRSWSCQARE